MKQLTIVLTAFILLSACKKTEHGAPDVETISRKLFDTARDGNFGKSEYLMPDKGTFRKIQEQKGIAITDVNSAYDAYTANAEKKFDAVEGMLPDWSTAKYLRTVTESSKSGNMATTMATTKFESPAGSNKFTFTAIKFNNRWYYDGDMTWIPKSE